MGLELYKSCRVLESLFQDLGLRVRSLGLRVQGSASSAYCFELRVKNRPSTGKGPSSCLLALENHNFMGLFGLKTTIAGPKP